MARPSSLGHLTWPLAALKVLWLVLFIFLCVLWFNLGIKIGDRLFRDDLKELLKQHHKLEFKPISLIEKAKSVSTHVLLLCAAICCTLLVISFMNIHPVEYLKGGAGKARGAAELVNIILGNPKANRLASLAGMLAVTLILSRRRPADPDASNANGTI